MAKTRLGTVRMYPACTAAKHFTFSGLMVSADKTYLWNMETKAHCKNGNKVRYTTTTVGIELRTMLATQC
jgi:hypothetical protein